MIYADNGPVARVYKSFGVNYRDTDFLRLVNGELFVDKEKEVKSLLPSYSYLNAGGEQPKFSDWSKIFSTLRNLLFLNFISTKKFDQLFLFLKEKIETPETDVGFKTVLDDFLKDYELIFCVNFLSGLSIKKVGLLLKNESISLPEIIGNPPLFIGWEKYSVACPKNLQGNSLEISDFSDFLSVVPVNHSADKAVGAWWNGLPEFKQKFLQPKIGQVIIYNHLRELGRWLTVKKITQLRNLLLSLARENNFIDPKNIFSIHFNDLLVGTIDEENCRKNKKLFSASEIVSSSCWSSNKTSLQGVSAGAAEGIFCRVEDIGSGRFAGNEIILYTDLLSPDLTKYFSQIVGIVSSAGSMLSHIAVVGREKGLPIVVGFSLAGSSIQIGDRIKINGGRGEIVKV
jgi:phosphohistidine swiveling domain-containing protein